MNDLELKRKRIETVVKVLGVGVVGFLVAPFAFIAIKGIVGLIVIAAISLLVINVAVPWFAVSIANWRLKALKAAAAANPIEMLENQYIKRESNLVKIRDNIKEFHVVVQELWSQIQEHNQRYPDRPSQFFEKYNKMKALLALRGQKYKAAQANLMKFSQLIDEKRSDWKIAQSAAKASKLAGIGEDFQSKLLTDTALSTIQDGLNLAFSELEVSLLDEQPIVDTVTVQVGSPEKKEPLLLEEKVGPPTLDLDFIDVDLVKVPVAR